MKKAIVQLSTAILGIGDDYDEAMAAARTGLPELKDSWIESPARSAIAGECVCIDISDELVEYGATDNWDVETNELGDLVAVLVTDQEAGR